MINLSEGIIDQFGDVETYFASCPPPDPEDEPHPSSGGFQFVPPEQPIRPGLIFDEDEWTESDIPPRPWTVRNYLLSGAITVFAGAPGISKSSLMVSFTCALVLGVPFGDFRPKRPCKVMLYNVEDNKDEQRRRFSAAMRQFGRPISDLTGKVCRVGVETIGTLLGDIGGVLGPLPAMEALEQRIVDFKPDVLILDPLVELHDRDENDNVEVRRVMAYFRTIATKYNLALVLLHHFRKGVAIAGDIESARGASSVVGAARIAFTITGMSEKDAEAMGMSDSQRKHYVRVDEGKANYSSITDAAWFEKTVHVLDNATADDEADAVMTCAPWDPPIDVITPERRAEIEADIAVGSATGPWTAKLSKDARSIRHLFSQHGVTTPKGQQTLLDDLLLHGFEIGTFRRANRGKAQGIRTAAGRPNNVTWLLEPDESPREE